MTTLFAILLLAVWTYLASCFEAESYQNLYVNRLRSLFFRPVAALERALPRNPPEWLAPTALFAALLALSGAAPAALGTPCAVTFCDRIRLFAASSGFGARVAMTASAFVLLVAKLSVLRLLLAWRLGPYGGSSPLEFLETATWPLPRLGAPGAARGQRTASLWVQAAATAALFLAGAALALGASALQPVGGGYAPQLAMAAAVDTLLLMRNLLFIFCICTFFGFSAMSPSYGGAGDWMNFLGMAARDWIDTAIRATIGREVAFGPIGFAPLILFFAAGLLHRVLASLVI